MKKQQNYLLTALICLMTAFVTQAYAPLTFKPVPNTTDLTNNNILCLLQDSQGYIWMGTDHGLNRFDGYKVKHYLLNGTESKHIFSVDEDAMGNIWVVMGYGGRVMVYNHIDDAFVTAQQFLADRGVDMPDVSRVFVDEDGYVWMTANQLLYRFDHQNNELNAVNQPVGDDVYSLIKHNDDVYVAPAHSLLRVDTRTWNIDSVKVGNPRLRDLIESDNHKTLFKDDNSTIWLFTHEDPTLWHREMYKPDFEQLVLPSENFVINSIVDDHRGSIWVATNQEGAYKIDKSTGEAQNVNLKSGDKEGFYNINVLLVDNLNNVWGGGFTSGVRMLNDRDRAVKAYSIPGENVIMLFLDSQKRLWVGVEGEGLTIRYPNKAFNVDIPKCNVTAMAEDQAGRIWIGTYLSGLYCYDEGKISHYTTENSTLPEDNVYAIEVDDNGYLWLGTLNHGLIRFTGENFTREFEEINSVGSIAFDQGSNKLYIAGDVGLGILDLRTGKSEVLNANREGTVEFPNRSIHKVVLGCDGLLWMGMPGGVVQWNPRTDAARLITTADGIPGNLIFSMKEDDKGGIWITTDKGAAEIRHTDDNITVRRYTKADGLLSDRTSYNALSLGNEGGMLIGGEGGFTFIDINEADRSYDYTPFSVTSVTVNSKPLPNSYIEHKDSLWSIKIPAQLTKEGSSVQISLSDFNYSVIGRQQIYCNINDTDEWLPLSDSQIAFGQLRPGKYDIRLKRMNVTGGFDDEYTYIKINVEPQFWASFWGTTIKVVIVALILAIILLSLYRYRRAKTLEVKQREEAARKAEVDEVKMRFFTNLSHDLRTPLSLIITPLEELKKLDIDDRAHRNIDVAYKNAQHLMSLVTQLLDMRKLEVKAEKLNAVTGDLVAFVAEQFSTFKEFSDNNGRNLLFHSGIDSLILAFDKDKIKRVVYNLLSNALKFTNKGGNIVVDIWLDCDRAYVSVTDDGVGVPDDLKLRIFDRFYQARNSEPQEVGSGVGLHIVKEYIKMHGGDVEVTDNKPNGSCFVFWLPIKTTDENKEYDEDTLTEINTNGKPTILIVEDNVDFRNFLVDNLSDDYNVIGAENGSQALNLLDVHNIDIAITDVMMPVMDGIELCRRIKTDVKWSHIPVIIITARATDQQQLEGLESGADDYIAKPFGIDMLKLRITKFLEWRKKIIERMNSKIEVKPSEITVNHVDEEFVKKAISIVEENLANPDFSVEELASKMSLSRTGFYRKINSLTGKSPLEFIQFLRLGHAKRLLESGMNVSEVAYAVGYNQPKYFSKQFHDAFGVTPSDYRRNSND